MSQQIVHVAPVQAGKVFGLMYGALSVLFIPLFMLPALVGAKGAPPIWFPILFIPIYAGAGFVMTAGMAWAYNIIAMRVGGLEVTIVTSSDDGTIVR